MATAKWFRVVVKGAWIALLLGLVQGQRAASAAPPAAASAAAPVSASASAPAAARASAPVPADAVTPRLAELRARAGKPEAVTALLGALDLWDEVALMRAAERLGDRARGAALQKALGLVTEWSIIGPFDNEGRGGHDTPYAPETRAGDESQAEQRGKERMVAWRRYGLPVIDGLVSFDATLRPDENVVGYARAYVKSDKARTIAVRTGSAGALKVWVNRALVVSRDVYRPLGFDQDAGLAKLDKGWNSILVKASALEDAWLFRLRLTTPEGAPLVLEQAWGGVTQIDDLPAGARPASELAGVVGLERAQSAGKPVAGKLRELGELLRARTRGAGAKQAALWADLGDYLAEVSPDERTAETARAALTQAVQLAAATDPARGGYRIALAGVIEDANQRRGELQHAADDAAAVKDDATWVRAQIALGHAYQAAGRDRLAEDAWRAAIARAGSDAGSVLGARMALIRAVAAHGLSAFALAQAEALEAVSAPAGRSEPTRLVLELARDLGRPARARTALEALLPAHADEVNLYAQASELAFERGEVAEGVAWLDRALALRPGSSALTLAKASALEDAGKLGDAVAAVDATQQTLPEDAGLHERAGRLLIQKGDRAAGIARLLRALELKPQNPPLRQYLALIDPTQDKGLEKLYGRDPAAIIKKHAKLAPAGEPGVVLLDAQVTRVHENGLSEVYHQRLIKVLDDTGRDALMEQSISFTPDTQSVDVLAARVHKPSGAIVEASGRGERTISEPWYNMYYDYRAVAFEWSSLQVGDVIELEYVVSDVGRRNLFNDYFGDVTYLAERMRRAETDIVLVTPRDRTFYFNQPRLPGLQATVDVQGEQRIYRFRAFDTGRLLDEPAAPGATEITPYLHVSTYKSWEDVGRWWWGLVKDQLTPDDALRAAARAAVAGIPAGDDLAKMKAIHSLAVKSTRYIALEFGIHGWKPYRVTQVFQRKFGDCKDKASLIVALLGEVGIEAHLVIVRTRRNGDIAIEPASLAVFDHAIAYVPKFDLYLDGTAEFSGSYELPAQDQGATVLVVDQKGGARLTKTPVYGANKNRTARKLDITLAVEGDAAGSAEVAETVDVTGQQAATWRSYYQSKDERRERYEQVWNAWHPGSRAESVELPTLEDLEQPIHATAKVVVPTMLTRDGTAWSAFASARESEFARGYARLSSRQYDLVLDFPWEQEEELTFRLPLGTRAGALPKESKLNSDFGFFTLRVVGDQPGKVVVSYTLSIVKERIAKKDYPEFRKWLLGVDAALNQRIVVVAQ